MVFELKNKDFATTFKLTIHAASMKFEKKRFTALNNWKSNDFNLQPHFINVLKPVVSPAGASNNMATERGINVRNL